MRLLSNRLKPEKTGRNEKSLRNSQKRTLVPPAHPPQPHPPHSPLPLQDRAQVPFRNGRSLRDRIGRLCKYRMALIVMGGWERLEVHLHLQYLSNPRYQALGQAQERRRQRDEGRSGIMMRRHGKWALCKDQEGNTQIRTKG